MKRGFIRNIISVGCLLLSALLLCVPALADANAWLNTDIDGAVTEDTPVARPQDDFNLAMNRDYILNLVIPEGNTGTGGFNELNQIVNQMRLDAIRDETLTGHDAELVRRYYNMLLDWDTRDALGVEPAMPYVNQLRAIDSLEAMTEWFADKRRGGITAFLSEGEKGGNTGCLFAYSVSNSSDDPSARVLSITPIGLSLGDPAEYTELSENGRVTKEAATAKWTALLHHLGFSEAETAKMIDNTFALEALLAAQQSDLETKKNPANQAQYWNPTDLAGIVAMCGAFPVGEILKGWGMDHVRLPFDYELIEDKEGNPVESGYGHIQDAIDWCGKYGLNMVLDLHKTMGYSFDDAFGERGFFDSDALQERFYKLWENVASRFGKYDDRVAFEDRDEIKQILRSGENQSGNYLIVRAEYDFKIRNIFCRLGDFSGI